MAKRRAEGRRANELRPLEITRGYTKFSPGSVLIRTGDTAVLCTASVADSVPGWLEGKDFNTSTDSEVMLWVGCGPYHAPVFEDISVRPMEIAEGALTVLNAMGIAPLLWTRVMGVVSLAGLLALLPGATRRLSPTAGNLAGGKGHSLGHSGFDKPWSHGVDGDAPRPKCAG